ncbi:MAG: flagellar biosynthesis protein FlhF [Deltaproteobacteria bacterium]|nr:flagellar biosynthesis protein FlhF [Deltaproteobacteria bacterium]
MHIKSFKGPTVRDAIKAVKAELGGNALIINTKRLSTGLYEVIAAIDYDLTRPVDLTIPFGRSGGPASGDMGPDGRRGAEAHETPGTLSSGAGNRTACAESEIPAIDAELKELRELKDFCQNIAAQSATEHSRTYRKMEEELISNGVDKRLARKILVSAFNGAGKGKPDDEGAIKSCMRERILERIDVEDPLEGKSPIAFVGPAGVGKTTTIAKLAAVQALKKKRRVALLSMDTHRIAATEQLKVYGRIIGVPVEVARTPEELASLIAMHNDKDNILIDTAGRSQRSSAHMKELSALAALTPGLRFNLVLSAQTRDEALYDSIKGFSAVPYSSLTFTKLDEGPSYGQMLNTAMLAKRPVAYLSSGQRVPEDIELASAERLLNLFMPN